MKWKVGIIREGKVPVDRRVPFTPQQAREIMRRFPNVTVVCQRSRIRCFKDEEYEHEGVAVVEHLYDCDIIMGIKEVPISNLIGGKTYLFFSHTIKKQPYNRRLLQTILKKKIHLVDYEVLRDAQGRRLVAFGRYAGIVGAYNGLWTFSKKYGGFRIKRAYKCFDYEDLKAQFPHIKLPPIKIVLTGSGRVGNGACEVLDAVGVKKVSPERFLQDTFDYPVYVQLSSKDYHQHFENKPFNRQEFHDHPERYVSTFFTFAQACDLLIAGAYWNPRAPKLFTRDQMKAPSFRIKIIADISCDINGSIPATVQPTDVNNPIFDYDIATHTVQPPLSNRDHITVMAIDNLPCELPRSASRDFGKDLMDNILPALFISDDKGIIERGSLTCNGRLTEGFSYLEEYAQDKSG